MDYLRGPCQIGFSATETIVIRLAWVPGLLGDTVGSSEPQAPGRTEGRVRGIMGAGNGRNTFLSYVPWGQAVLYS